MRGKALARGATLWKFTCHWQYYPEANLLSPQLPIGSDRLRRHVVEDRAHRSSGTADARHMASERRVRARHMHLPHMPVEGHEHGRHNLRRVGTRPLIRQSDLPARKQVGLGLPAK